MTKKRHKTKILTLFLSLAMVLSFMPWSAVSAEDGVTDVTHVDKAADYPWTDMLTVKQTLKEKEVNNGGSPTMIAYVESVVSVSNPHMKSLESEDGDILLDESNGYTYTHNGGEFGNFYDKMFCGDIEYRLNLIKDVEKKEQNTTISRDMTYELIPVKSGSGSGFSPKLDLLTNPYSVTHHAFSNGSHGEYSLSLSFKVPDNVDKPVLLRLNINELFGTLCELSINGKALTTDYSSDLFTATASIGPSIAIPDSLFIDPMPGDYARSNAVSKFVLGPGDTVDVSVKNLYSLLFSGKASYKIGFDLNGADYYWETVLSGNYSADKFAEKKQNLSDLISDVENMMTRYDIGKYKEDAESFVSNAKVVEALTIDDIDADKRITDYTGRLNDFKEWISDACSLLLTQEKIDDAKAELDAIDISGYSKEVRDKLSGIISKAKSDIDNAESNDAIDAILKEAKIDIQMFSEEFSKKYYVKFVDEDGNLITPINYKVSTLGYSSYYFLTSEQFDTNGDAFYVESYTNPPDYYTVDFLEFSDNPIEVNSSKKVSKKVVSDRFVGYTVTSHEERYKAEIFENETPEGYAPLGGSVKVDVYTEANRLQILKDTTGRAYVSGDTIYIVYHKLTESEIALQSVKEQAFAVVNSVDLDDYSGNDRTVMENAVNNTKRLINQADSIEEVNSAVSMFDFVKSSAKTDAQKAEEAGSSGNNPSGGNSGDNDNGSNSGSDNGSNTGNTGNNNSDSKDKPQSGTQGKDNKTDGSPANQDKDSEAGGSSADQNSENNVIQGDAVSPASPIDFSKVDSMIMNAKNDKDIKGSTFGLLKLQSKKQGKKNIKLSWSKVPGATKYVVYGNLCGKKNVKLKTLSRSKLNIRKIGKAKLKSGKHYKFTVVAQSGDKAFAVSKMVHVMTKGHSKFDNHIKVKVDKKAAKAAKAMKKGDSLSLKAKAVSKKGKKVKTHRKIAYESDNTAVAVVKGGKVKAVGEGKCKIFCYAQNGVSKVVPVVVR